MGIDGDIPGELLRTWAVDAWNNETAEELEAPCVWLEDYLIHDKQLSTEKRYTLRELFDHFWGPVKRDLLEVAPRSDTRLRVYGMVCDDRKRVTKFKLRTQVKRVEAVRSSDAKHERDAPEPYPVGCRLDLERGVVDADDDQTIDPLIDLRRLRMMRGGDLLRWTHFMPFVREAMADAPCGRLFFFDFDGHPQWFGEPASAYSLPREQPMGEADPALIWWCHYLRESDAFPVVKRLRTTDSDLVPLSLLYHQKNRVDGQRMIWHRTHCERLDLGRVAWHVERRLGMDPLDAQVVALDKRKARAVALGWFSFMCAMCGCDFVHKKDYVARAGYTEIRRTVENMARMVYQGRVAWHTPHELVVFFVRMLYTERWMDRAGRVTVPRWAWKPPTREWYDPMSLRLLRSSDRWGEGVLPSDRYLEIVSLRLDFTLPYWGNAAQGARADLADPQMWLRVEELERGETKTTNAVHCTPTPLAIQ